MATYISMGSLKVDFRILKELADVIAKSLSMVFENSWCSGEDPIDWEKGNCILFLKNGGGGRKEDLVDYTCHIHLCAWEVMEKWPRTCKTRRLSEVTSMVSPRTNRA